MHKLPNIKESHSIVDEGSQQRLWSWLVLCDDSMKNIDSHRGTPLIISGTVLSLHEDPGPVNDDENLKMIRGNTLSVLSQLSKWGHLNADPTSMQTVRQALQLDSAQADPGIEGASNLFYYLFDDWRAVYSTFAAFGERLKKLVYFSLPPSPSPPLMQRCRNMRFLVIW